MSTSNALGMAPDVVTAGECNWVIVTQLLGEIRCSLSVGHHGDHRFAVDQVATAFRGDSNRSQSHEDLVKGEA
jgi:hypothetical protein